VPLIVMVGIGVLPYACAKRRRPARRRFAFVKTVVWTGKPS
jgi:hypothetical protein